MFGKITADLTGSADVCTCVPKDQFQAVNSLSFILPHEVPFIVLKSGKEEHIFTDHAYIVCKGDSAASARRLVTRYSYYDHLITNVQFETAGMGVTDRDVELKFSVNQERVSIDIWKKEVDVARVYYKALSAVSSVQKKNANMVGLAKEALPKMGTGDVMQSIAWAEAISNKFFPSNYGFVFSSFIQ